MTDRKKVIKDIEECLSASCRGYRPRLSCPYNEKEWDIMREALELLKEQELTEEEFMTHIITEICDYAVKNNMEPDDTLSTVADNLKAILAISTFNGWQGGEVNEITF